MADLKNITEDYVVSIAPNDAAVKNARKLSNTNKFSNLKKTDDEKLIYGECKGSGAKPYYTSADFIGDTPVFRCSCPSRQFPCKHSLALLFDYISGKTFESGEVPEDIQQKRQKIEKKTENAKKPKKVNKSAATKKLKKQREGLELAESFVNDIISRGISAINSASSSQYEALAKQLGDYYLPEPQAIMLEIISLANRISENAEDKQMSEFTKLCVKLSVSVRKSMAYIDGKLESGEIMPEDNILYEAMGNVWKLTQLKDLGLYKQDSEIVQLYFNNINDEVHKMIIDKAYWIDLTDGEICITENKRPYKAMYHIKEEDSLFDVYKVKELCRYPGGLNRRVRWDNAETRYLEKNDCSKAVSLAENSLSEAIKKVKNELKNTLSNKYAAMLLKCDRIEFTEEGYGVMKLGDETIALKEYENMNTLNVLKIVDSSYYNSGESALFGEFFYVQEERKIYLCPLAIVTQNEIIRLC